ncbi:MAG TPA: AMP-binding protein [Streptosporangiaceae bacterium]|nr:AMP-binding protein [Streptosporangiaceae bacterium]
MTSAELADQGIPDGPWTSAALWSSAGWRVHRAAADSDGPGAGDWAGAATIPELATRSAQRVPSRVAVSVDGQPVTHGQLDAEAKQAAGWLAGRLGGGERMLLAAGTSLGFLRWYLGALRAGVIVVLANPGYTAAELGHLVADSGARLAVADPVPAQRLSSLDLAGLELAGLERAEQVPPDPPRALPVLDDTALLAYTSGTTGRPKGVPLTHRQLAASIRGAMAAWRWTAGDVLVHALPLFHQHGLGGVHATLIAGSTAHLRSRFDPADLIAAARAGGGTVLFGVPATYQALLDSAEGPAAAGATAAGSPAAGATAAGSPAAGATAAGSPAAGVPLLPSLRLAVCGSAPLSPALAARLPGLLGRLPLIRYGTTETGLDVSNPVDAPRPDTVGLPLPGVECRIWCAGREAPPGTDGEIQLRGPQVFTGYWHDATATAEAFTADGWFRTGDLGVIDPACGHLVIRGRTKELIISGGMNVYPREVELALEQHPSVAEAAVAGLPHPRWGEQVTAWIVPRPGAAVSEAELVAHTRTLLAAYKCPKQVFALAALPRDQLGKLNRAALTATSGHPPDHSPR